MPAHARRTTLPVARPLAVVATVAGICAAVVGYPSTPAHSSRVAGPAPTLAAAAATAVTVTGRDSQRRAVSRHGQRDTDTRASRSHRRTGWVRPVPGPVTSRFGPRWGTMHPGVDIGARYGAKVHAITGGRVTYAGWIPGYGKIVRIHGDGKTFFYPHLSHIRIRHGRVAEGQVLGRVGSTGYSTGPHLHVEIRIHHRPVDPLPILRNHGVHLLR